MPIRYEHHITRQMVRDHPDWYFIFGDNLDRRGLGGQAKEMRGEPNAIGIVTKRWPSRDSDAYFTDEDFPAFKAASSGAFARIRAHLEAGGTVVFPSDGIGTGRADLERRAPRIWASLQRAIAKLEAIEPTPSPSPVEGS